MSFAVLIVDSGVPFGSVSAWPGATAHSGLRLGMTHPADPASCLAWLRRREVEDLLLLGRPDVHTPAHVLAPTIAGARPGTAATLRIIDATTLAMAVAAGHALELRVAPPVAYRHVQDSLAAGVNGAYLSRVTRLEHPKPSLWQHLTSIFGRKHVAILGKQGGVHRTGQVPALPEAAALFIAAEDGSEEFESVLATLPGPVSIHSVPPTVPTRSSFGSRGVEFFAFVAPEVQGNGAQCPSCRHATASSSCPFCRTRIHQKEFIA